MPEVAMGLIICAINAQLIELSGSSTPVDPVVRSLSTIASIVPDLELHLQPGLLALQPVAEEQRLCLHLEQLGRLMQHMEGSSWRAFYRCASRLMRLVRRTEAWMRLRSRSKSDRRLSVSVAETSGSYFSTDQMVTADIADSASCTGMRLTAEEVQQLLHIAQQLSGESNVNSVLLQFSATQKSENDGTGFHCHCVIVDAGSDGKSASFVSHEMRKVRSAADAQVAIQQSAVNFLKMGYPPSQQTVQWHNELRRLNLRKEKMLNQLALLRKADREYGAGTQSDQSRQQQISTLLDDQGMEQGYEDILNQSKEDKKVQQPQPMQDTKQVQVFDTSDLAYALPTVKDVSEIKYQLTQMLEPNKIGLQSENDQRDGELYKQMQRLHQTELKSQLRLQQLDQEQVKFKVQYQTQPTNAAANQIQFEEIQNIQKHLKGPLVLQTTNNITLRQTVEQVHRSSESEATHPSSRVKIRKRLAQESRATLPVIVATNHSDFLPDRIEMQPSRSTVIKNRTAGCSSVPESDAMQSVVLTTITNLRRSHRALASQPDLASTRTQTTSCESHDYSTPVNESSECVVNRQAMQREVEKLRAFRMPEKASDKPDKSAKDEKRAKSQKNRTSKSRHAQNNPPTKDQKSDEARQSAKYFRTDKATVKNSDRSKQPSPSGGSIIFAQRRESHAPVLAHPTEISVPKKLQSTCNTMSFSEERVKVRERKHRGQQVVANEDPSHVPSEKGSEKETAGHARVEDDQKKKRNSKRGKHSHVKETQVIEKPQAEPTEAGYPDEQQAVQEASRPRSSDAKQRSRKSSKDNKRKEAHSKSAAVPNDLVELRLTAADRVETITQLEKCGPTGKKPNESEANLLSPSNIEANAVSQQSSMRSKGKSERANRRKSERRDKGK